MSCHPSDQRRRRRRRRRLAQSLPPPPSSALDVDDVRCGAPVAALPVSLQEPWRPVPSSTPRSRLATVRGRRRRRRRGRRGSRGRGGRRITAISGARRDRRGRKSVWALSSGLLMRGWIMISSVWLQFALVWWWGWSGWWWWVVWWWRLWRDLWSYRYELGANCICSQDAVDLDLFATSPLRMCPRQPHPVHIRISDGIGVIHFKLIYIHSAAAVSGSGGRGEGRGGVGGGGSQRSFEIP